jgi:hypothetical protein
VGDRPLGRYIYRVRTTAKSESLAGRFERLTLTHWSARSVAQVFGVEAAQAAELVARMGSGESGSR